MHGGGEIQNNFIESLDDNLQSLMQQVFDHMRMAGEAGTLLKIEDSILTAIRDVYGEYGDLFRKNDEKRWEKAENDLIRALIKYAEGGNNGQAISRRLFVNDADRGFAFIDLCRKRYDAIVMNPPFGDLPNNFFQYGAREYPRTKYDLGTIFIERATELALPNARCGWITSRTWIALYLLEGFRLNLLYYKGRLQLVADFGIGVLDALVETAACVLDMQGQPNKSSIVFRLLESKDKEHDLLNRIASDARIPIITNIDLLSSLPRAVFGYWLPRRFIERITTFYSMNRYGGEARQGLATTDDFRFFRALWEVPRTSIGFERRWVPLAKGGEYEPYYDDLHLVIDYDLDGLVLKTYLVCNKGQKHWSRRIASSEHYGRSGLTYPERTTSDFSPRPLPAGSIFTATGQSIFFKSTDDALVYLGIAYSRVFKMLIELFIGAGDASESGSAARHYTSGILNEMPLPALSGGLARIADLCREAISIRRRHYMLNEMTIDFIHPALIGEMIDASLAKSIDKAATKYFKETINLLEIGHEIDIEVASAYGIDDTKILDVEICPYPLSYPQSDSSSISNETFLNLTRIIEQVCNRWGYKRAFTKKAYWANRIIEILWHYEGKSFDLDPSLVAQCCPYLKTPAIDLVSYVIGALFGRWDVRIAQDPSLAPKPNSPFDPLPACPPGMLIAPNGLPSEPGKIKRISKTYSENCTISDSDYPIQIAWNSILVDDPGFEGGQHHKDDIVLRTRDLFALFWKEPQNIEQEICNFLDVRGIRSYFRISFFKDHLSRYSKSRRKAPIYWQLATPSASYSVWLYYHRFTKDTFYNVLNDYVDKKLQFEERQLFNKQKQYGASPTATQRKEITARESFVEELSNFKEEVARIAPLWNPNLNDGVIINFAPLWRLVPQNKPWQKECRKVWDKLVKGDYDWAHLAMHLWPERVVPKCTKDRSLAIAHGLDDLFWTEDDKGKPKPKKVSKDAIDALIQERTSPTVKAALDDLLKTPTPANMTGKKWKKRA